jgi:hypothetical protein
MQSIITFLQDWKQHVRRMQISTILKNITANLRRGELLEDHQRDGMKP